MADIGTIIGYIFGGFGTLLAIGNFIYTWLKTRIKGPDFRINKIWGLTSDPTKAGQQMQNSHNIKSSPMELWR